MNASQKISKCNSEDYYNTHRPPLLNIAKKAHRLTNTDTGPTQIQVLALHSLRSCCAPCWDKTTNLSLVTRNQKTNHGFDSFSGHLVQDHCWLNKFSFAF